MLRNGRGGCQEVDQNGLCDTCKLLVNETKDITGRLDSSENPTLTVVKRSYM